MERHCPEGIRQWIGPLKNTKAPLTLVACIPFTDPVLLHEKLEINSKTFKEKIGWLSSNSYCVPTGKTQYAKIAKLVQKAASGSIALLALAVGPGPRDAFLASTSGLNSAPVCTLDRPESDVRAGWAKGLQPRYASRSAFAIVLSSCGELRCETVAMGRRYNSEFEKDLCEDERSMVWSMSVGRRNKKSRPLGLSLGERSCELDIVHRHNTDAKEIFPTDGRKDAGDMVGHFAFGRAENLRGVDIFFVENVELHQLME
ncbi:hypothetical protein WN51_09915 [Melipona quadrifasciata]|uniref:Uncharacterized protein n=1 Tax=Melipona quadrifasciata TaxID=166423 RepID=A0A0M9A7Z2_9HYME|nr:hypothetical protein WN51_09915 [Melipona quadrifasciata]